MIALLQRVKRAKVTVDDQIVGSIGQGLLVLLGVEQQDQVAATERLCERVLNYRVFSDDQGKMNLSLRDIAGELLVVSQFTLVADTKKGNRPSFSGAGAPDLSKQLYQHFVQHAKAQGITTETGIFAADMQVELVNDGPVTFQLSI